MLICYSCLWGFVHVLINFYFAITILNSCRCLHRRRQHHFRDAYRLQHPFYCFLVADSSVPSSANHSANHSGVRSNSISFLFCIFFFITISAFLCIYAMLHYISILCSWLVYDSLNFYGSSLR